MQRRSGFLLLAAVPLLVGLAVLAFAIHRHGETLAQREREVVEAAWLTSKEGELRHYLGLAHSAIAPLVATGNDEATRQRALALLGSMEFGRDGYFFVYDLAGHNLMHPRQPELVGQDLWNLRDANGAPTIQQLIAAARAGGADGSVVRYLWRKPSSQQTVGKLGCVMLIEPWGWMIGTGLYLDDVEDAVAKVDAAAKSQIDETLAWVAGIAALGLMLVGIGGMALNITDHRQSDAKLRLLAQQLVRSQEDERGRLSRELHDGVSQLLVSTKLMIEAAQEHLRQSQPPAHAIDAPLERALERLNTTLGEVRRISHNLRPMLLDDLGLPAALENLAREFRGSANGAPHFICRIDGTPLDLSGAANTALFRIAQEALTNVLRHAHAAEVVLELEYVADTVSLRIRDDGRGFDEQAVQRDPHGGIGLRNMRERLLALGGTMRVASGPGGTVLEANLPIHALRKEHAA